MRRTVASVANALVAPEFPSPESLVANVPLEAVAERTMKSAPETAAAVVNESSTLVTVWPRTLEYMIDHAHVRRGVQGIGAIAHFVPVNIADEYDVRRV